MPQRHTGRRISSYDEGPHNRKQRRDREFGHRANGFKKGGHHRHDEVRFVTTSGKKAKASKKTKAGKKAKSGHKHAGGKKRR